MFLQLSACDLCKAQSTVSDDDVMLGDLVKAAQPALQAEQCLLLRVLRSFLSSYAIIVCHLRTQLVLDLSPSCV